jgi:hypothetical protein
MKIELDVDHVEVLVDCGGTDQVYIQLSKRMPPGFPKNVYQTAATISIEAGQGVAWACNALGLVQEQLTIISMKTGLVQEGY